MWEQMKINRRKTLFFWVVTGLFFLLLGVAFSYLGLYFGINRLYTVLFMFFIFIGLSLFVYFNGDKMLLKISEARKVDHSVHPRLFNIVKEMKLAANLPFVPDVYIIPSLSINAFATGIRPGKCSIIVTAGLLSKLNREELQAVVAHETSHILNRDILLLTFLGSLWGTFTIMAMLFFLLIGGLGRGKSNQRGFFRINNKRRQRNRSRSELMSFAQSSWIMGRFFYKILSDTREYLADASAVRLTRNPYALASAMEKIQKEKNRLIKANSITAPMYIESPLNDASKTHPPIGKRIKILREMTHGAHLGEYQRAYNSVVDKGKNIFNSKALKEDNYVSIKNKQKKEVKKEKEVEKEDEKENNEIKQKVKFFDCRCGLKIKVPGDYGRKKFSCPRCGKIYNSDTMKDIEFNTRHFKAINFVKGLDELPVREVNQIEYDEKGNPYYVVKHKECETFLCECGSMVRVPQVYSLGSIECKSCGKNIRLEFKDEVEYEFERVVKDEMGHSYIEIGEEWKRVGCKCGNIIRLSPNFAGKHLSCRECGKRILVKGGKNKTAGPKSEENKSDVKKINDKLTYEREGGWESFFCQCGKKLELSPVFSARFIKCRRCNEKVYIK